MRVSVVVIIVLLFASLGCNLTGSNAQYREPSPTPIVLLRTSVSTASPVPTNTPTKTSTPSATAIADDQNVIEKTACIVQSAWPLYTIQRGDTLSQLAERVGSTTAVLASVNCLQNPGLLSVGQVLHVPRLPPPVTATPSPWPDYRGENGQIGVAYDGARWIGDRYVTTPGHAIYLIWPEAPRDATRVEFYAQVTSPSSRRTLIGTDDTVSTEAGIAWQLPVNQEITAVLSAEAFSHNALLMRTRINVLIEVRHETPTPVPDDGSVRVSPYSSYDHATYAVRAGTRVRLTWPEAPISAQRVEFHYYNLNSPGSAPIILGSDTTPGNGAELEWTVPPNLWAELDAVAYYNNGQTQHTNFRPYIQAIVSPPPGNYGSVAVLPYLRMDGSWYILLAGQQVTVNWPGSPLNNVARVEFYSAPTGTGSTRTIIQVDQDLSNGAAITWTVPPAGPIGHLEAAAFDANGALIAEAGGISALSEAP